MKRVDQLTFPRFLAVLVVLFFHGGGGIYYQALSGLPFSALFISSTTAVTFLYALSGFVMVLGHYRPAEKHSLEDYWKARLIRIYPLYILAFFLTSYYYDLTLITTNWKDALANVFVAQAWLPKYAQIFNYPAWSVTVEIFFYAIFPIFAWWASRQSVKKLIVFSLAAWAFTQTVHHTLWIGFFPAWKNFLIYFPLFHLSSFLLGAAGGIWFLKEGRQQKNNPRLNLTFLSLGIALVSAYIIASRKITYFPHADQLMAGFLAPFLTLIILTLALDTTRLSNFLKHPALLALGESAYAIYIFHIPVKWLYARALENSPRLFDYTYTPLIIAFGLLVTFYIDRPLRGWLKKAFQNISLPLLFLDLAALSFSVYFIFLFRFGDLRVRAPHYSTFLLMYWSVFALRTLISAKFKTFSPSMITNSFPRFFLILFLSVTAASVSVALWMYIGYLFQWVKFFPLSVIALDWAAMLCLSLFTRLGLKFANTYYSNRHTIDD